jgi:hypothetical protein
MNISIQVAAAKLVAGLLACAIMVIARPSLPQRERSFGKGAVPSSLAFRAIAFCIVLLVAIGLSSQNWVSIPSQATSSRYVVSLLMSVGLLQLGLSDHPLRVGVGLLTLISGFEIIYSSLEPSLAVAALMAAVHLGIAVVVSYLLLHQIDEPTVAEQQR